MKKLNEASKYKLGVNIIFTKNAIFDVDQDTTITVPKDAMGSVASIRGRIMTISLDKTIKDSDGKKVRFIQINKYDPRNHDILKPTLGAKVKGTASKVAKSVGLKEMVDQVVNGNSAEEVLSGNVV